MADPTQAHNEALFPMLKMIVAAGPNESDQWVIMESLCLGIGKLHGEWFAPHPDILAEINRINAATTTKGQSNV